jgi:hypothetical protein
MRKLIADISIWFATAVFISSGSAVASDMGNTYDLINDLCGPHVAVPIVERRVSSERFCSEILPSIILAFDNDIPNVCGTMINIFFNKYKNPEPMIKACGDVAFQKIQAVEERDKQKWLNIGKIGGAITSGKPAPPAMESSSYRLANQSVVGNKRICTYCCRANSQFNVQLDVNQMCPINW